MDKTFPDLKNFKEHSAHAVWHKYLLLIGKIRAQFSIPQKHWWHVALIPSLHGLTTGLLEHAGEGFEIEVNFHSSSLQVNYRDDSAPTSISLAGQSSRELYSQLSSEFEKINITLKIADDVLSDDETKDFPASHSSKIADTLYFINHAFTVVRNEQRQETGPVLLWPHHFDMAFLWFSGHLIPDTDPADAEYSDEQMNIGFSFGDSSIPEAYFYISAYPWKDEFAQSKLPAGAYWHTEGFNAAILPAKVLHANSDPKNYLQDFSQQLLDVGKQLMLNTPS